MASTPLAPGSTIGILGGGQLGRMLAMAAAKLGLTCHIYCDDENAPAFAVSKKNTLGAYDDEAALLAFAKSVDVATLEFENVPAAALTTVAKAAPVFPPPRAVEVSQDRLAEKMFAGQLDIAVAPYREITSLKALDQAVQELGLPGLLKTRRLGYDGKGQARLNEKRDIAYAFDGLKGAPALFEKFIDFECEVSVIVVRGQAGQTSFYDPSENLHKNQILAETRVPAGIPENVASDARAIAGRMVEALDYCGVLCVELFYCGQNAPSPLIVNEIAPRVHNSGHWTMDACVISQFENHIRAVAGWPLGSCERHSNAVMRNLIGDDVKDWLALSGEENASLHLYGKRKIRPGRKMGHITRLSRKAEQS